MMRVIVCGSRDIESASDALRIWDALDAMEPRPTIIVHGDCRGADSIAKSWAVMRGVAQEPHPADWRCGARGGPVRNTKMAKAGADLCIAIYRPPLSMKSGTADMVRKAQRAGIRVVEVRL